MPEEILKWTIRVDFYPSQTKISEGRTNLSECVFEALFNGSSPKSCTHTLEKCFENAL
jgi:hypothetical protein